MLTVSTGNAGTDDVELGPDRADREHDPRTEIPGDVVHTVGSIHALDIARDTLIRGIADRRSASRRTGRRGERCRVSDTAPKGA